MQLIKHHGTINMKPVYAHSSTYIDFNKDNGKEDLKFKVGDHARISKSHVSNQSEEIFMIRKIKNTVPWTYVTSDLNGEEIIERFMKKS